MGSSFHTTHYLNEILGGSCGKNAYFGGKLSEHQLQNSRISFVNFSTYITFKSDGHDNIPGKY